MSRGCPVVSTINHSVQVPCFFALRASSVYSGSGVETACGAEICGAGHGRLDRDSLEEAVSEPATQARYTISVFDRHSRQSEE